MSEFNRSRSDVRAGARDIGLKGDMAPRAMEESHDRFSDQPGDQRDTRDLAA
jgi:hypothetical protein